MRNDARRILTLALIYGIGMMVALPLIWLFG